jgi:ABC-type Fe3+ transport system permease subunit
LKESAYAIGCTRWEVVRHIVLPYTRIGVVGGVMLGLGRALGETMAVTFVIGNAHKLSWSLFAPGNSIASTLANEFAEAEAGLHMSSLFALGLILFAITFIVRARRARNEHTRRPIQVGQSDLSASFANSPYRYLAVDMRNGVWYRFFAMDFVGTAHQWIGRDRH